MLLKQTNSILTRLVPVGLASNHLSWKQQQPLLISRLITDRFTLRK